MLVTAPAPSSTARASRAVSAPALAPEPLTLEQLVGLVLAGAPDLALDAMRAGAVSELVAVEVTDPEIGWTYRLLLEGKALPAPAALPCLKAVA